MDADKVLQLAKLARITLPAGEAETLSKEFEAILGYVGDVKTIAVASESGKRPEDFPVRNVMREDGRGDESGLYTERLLAEAPAREGGYVKVKKIL